MSGQSKGKPIIESERRAIWLRENLFHAITLRRIPGKQVIGKKIALLLLIFPKTLFNGD
jgi:hypothetical protein